MKKESSMKDKLNKKDIALILGICVLAGVLFFAMGRSTSAKQVIITLDGRQYGTYSLYEARTIKVESERGQNTVVIENGQVHVESADCPDRYCVKQGKLPGEHDNGRAIICLPHKLVIEVDDCETH